jgi:sec-independent protein translocase protein TatA
MLGLGFPELVVSLVVCLIIFGPGKLPQMGEALGKGVRDFQRALKPPPETDVTSSPSPGQDPEKPEKG